MLRQSLLIAVAAWVLALLLLAAPGPVPPAARADAEADPPAEAAAPDPAVTPPVPIERVDPDYPTAARLAGSEGTVVVRVVVDREGAVAGAEVLQTSDNEELDAAAVKAAWQWRFTPGRKDGAPVEAELAIPFRFEMS